MTTALCVVLGFLAGSALLLGAWLFGVDAAHAIVRKWPEAKRVMSASPYRVAPAREDGDTAAAVMAPKEAEPIVMCESGPRDACPACGATNVSYCRSHGESSVGVLERHLGLCKAAFCAVQLELEERISQPKLVDDARLQQTCMVCGAQWVCCPKYAA